MKVILDTNFLVIPEEKKIDIFEEIKKKEPKTKFITLKAVEEELKKMNTKASKIGRELLKKKEIKVIDTGKDEHTDDLILEYANKEKTAVATNDKELKKRCIERDIPVIYLRSSKKINITKR